MSCATLNHSYGECDRIFFDVEEVWEAWEAREAEYEAQEAEQGAREEYEEQEAEQGAKEAEQEEREVRNLLVRQIYFIQLYRHTNHLAVDL